METGLSVESKQRYFNKKKKKKRNVVHFKCKVGRKKSFKTGYY